MKLLLLEDIKSHASLFEYALEDLGWISDIEVIWARNYEEGEEKLNEHEEIEMMFVDYNLGIGKTGGDFCKIARENKPNTVIIILSSTDDPEIIQETYNNGANAFIPKFEDFDDALDKLNLIFNYYSKFNKAIIS
ncbi:MAG: response regulator [Bacteroidia bacterium]|nr:response regulator [Bacteroidia bacterium]